MLARSGGATVELQWAVLIILVALAVGITAILVVRRSAPEGSHYQNADRAVGVLGVVATGFAVLLGFVVYLAFQSFETSRSGAESEARIVVQQLQTAQLLPPDLSDEFSGNLVCYARTVVHDEWARMRAGTLSESTNPWGIAAFRTLSSIDPQTQQQQTVYARSLELRSDRQQARQDRIRGAEKVIPSPLWMVLFISAGVVLVFLVLFADPAESGFVQAMTMGGVVMVIVSSLLLLASLNRPFHPGPGSLNPIAMERTLRIIEDVTVEGLWSFPIPCDSLGAPLPAG